MTGPSDRADRRMRGFEPAAGLLRDTLRRAGEARGFAVARVLTHWPEIAGPRTAALCRPVRLRYGREGLGATLTLAVAGAAAPQVQMELPAIRDRVNACYGYNAVARIVLTQAPADGPATDGLAEKGAPFRPAAAPAPAPGVAEAAAGIAAGVGDPDLRRALEALGRNVISRAGQSPAGAPQPGGKDRR
ncbi:MAG: DUF721 domain-containing protein [Rhodobacteraceae bacterium]|nr:DUF721 domain-containing protein [Paracoccaceae bacterium]